MSITMSSPQDLLVRELKGHSFRLQNISERCDCDYHECSCDIHAHTYRALRREFPKLAIGELLSASDIEVTGNLIQEMNVISTTPGDFGKSPVEVPVDMYSVGSLIDGVPILRMGTHYYKDGVRLAKAYFKP